MAAKATNFAVIGHPVAHSLSPFIHKTFATACGIQLNYERIDATPDNFHNAVADFTAKGGRGLNVTLPHKHAAWQLASTASSRADRAKAANTLIRDEHSWLADNTDGCGFMRHLQRLGIEVKGLDVLIVGAGGAVWGIAGPLLDAMPKSVDICNRTKEKAVLLAKHFHNDGNIAACDQWPEKSYGLVINATASGIKGESIELPDSLLQSDSYCYDLAYSSEGDTPFVSWSKQAGAAIASDGLGMLIEQAAESFVLWHKIMPDTTSLYRHFSRV